jgi:hypothetical protein
MAIKLSGRNELIITRVADSRGTPSPERPQSYRATTRNPSDIQTLAINKINKRFIIILLNDFLYISFKSNVQIEIDKR